MIVTTFTLQRVMPGGYESTMLHPMDGRPRRPQSSHCNEHTGCQVSHHPLPIPSCQMYGTNAALQVREGKHIILVAIEHPDANKRRARVVDHHLRQNIAEDADVADDETAVMLPAPPVRRDLQPPNNFSRGSRCIHNGRRDAEETARTGHVVAHSGIVRDAARHGVHL